MLAGSSLPVPRTGTGPASTVRPWVVPSQGAQGQAGPATDPRRLLHPTGVAARRGSGWGRGRGFSAPRAPCAPNGASPQGAGTPQGARCRQGGTYPDPPAQSQCLAPAAQGRAWGSSGLGTHTTALAGRPKPLDGRAGPLHPVWRPTRAGRHTGVHGGPALTGVKGKAPPRPMGSRDPKGLGVGPHQHHRRGAPGTKREVPDGEPAKGRGRHQARGVSHWGFPSRSPWRVLARPPRDLVPVGG